MDAEALAFDDLYKYLANYSIQSTKRGYLNAEEHQILYLVESHSHLSNEGRWLVKFRGEVSFVSPALYDLLCNNTHNLVLGQTLPDGTLMTRDKAYEMANNNAFGPTSRAHQFQQQQALINTPLQQPSTASQDSKNTKTNRRAAPKREKPGAFVVGVRAEEGNPEPPVKKRRVTQRKKATTTTVDPSTVMDRMNMKLVDTLRKGDEPLPYCPTEEERSEREACEKKQQRDFNAVEVKFI